MKILCIYVDLNFECKIYEKKVHIIGSTRFLSGTYSNSIKAKIQNDTICFKITAETYFQIELKLEFGESNWAPHRSHHYFDMRF